MYGSKLGPAFATHRIKQEADVFDQPNRSSMPPQPGSTSTSIHGTFDASKKRCKLVRPPQALHVPCFCTQIMIGAPVVCPDGLKTLVNDVGSAL